ncbi:DUF3307 domain-containing protein [Salinicola aestuarinus]|uniref:DUF3307 domain-containing protein n=1 Tax=Salinicola aestuarinus TaxID=1949082 RepID=UPI000DA25453|nr:DUF3307 domain-containing protein [Salinicola aestuarinus]
MSDFELSILLTLLLVHVIGDFVLQSDAWAKEKAQRHARAHALYYHVGLHTLMTFAATLALGVELGQSLIGAGVVGGSHWLIDTLKSYTRGCPIRYFVIDQTIHVVVLTAVWAWLAGFDLTVLGDHLHGWITPRLLVMALTYLIALKPLSILIAMIMARWSRDVDTGGTLADAGARIGMLERFLILTFVLSDQLAAIGFLLTAKSVLRFGDLRRDRDRKLTEYVLLGTMLSVSMTLMLGLTARYLLAHL